MPMIDMPLEKLYEYSGISPSPKDLDEFWDENIKSLEDIELNVEIVESEFKCPFAKCYHLYFTGTNGARIHAKFIKPNKIEGKIPALLEFHGYQGGVDVAVAGSAVYKNGEVIKNISELKGNA